MALGNSNTLAKRSELPKFNGKPIENIYAVYEDSRYGKIDGKHVYYADVLFYDCQVSKYGDVETIRIKELPDDFKKFFGLLEDRKTSVWVNSMSFRLSGSGHASADQTLSLRGWASNATSDSFYIYRGFDWNEKVAHGGVILNGSKLAKTVLNVLNKEYDVEEVKFWQCDFKAKEGTLDFASKYPYEYTPIRIIDGTVYKDEKLPSWRWMHGMPFRVPETALNERGDVIDKKSICVWDDILKQHVYFERVDEVEAGDEDLIFVSFSYKSHSIYGNDGQAYCHIRRMIEKIGSNYCRYTIDKVDDEHWSVQYHEVRNDVNLKKQRTFQGMFYQIIKVVGSEQYGVAS